tara:strand:+ start:91 stop:639 length:549 start_codon:yes stop_codon:yes gene_type:complete
MYFSSFPTTTFDDVTLLDITRKAKLTSLIKSSALAYMNYTVQEGERPEDVAFYYYDDPAYAWLVLLSNDIVDPYTQWPKSAQDLEANIISKYASLANATGSAVTEWTKSQTISSNIIHYQSLNDPNVRLNRASYFNTPLPEFYAVRAYDYEVELNESRKEIVLINKGFLSTIKDQLKTIINE